LVRGRRATGDRAPRSPSRRPCARPRRSEASSSGKRVVRRPTQLFCFLCGSCVSTKTESAARDRAVTYRSVFVGAGCGAYFRRPDGFSRLSEIGCGGSLGAFSSWFGNLLAARAFAGCHSSPLPSRLLPTCDHRTDAPAISERDRLRHRLGIARVASKNPLVPEEAPYPAIQ